MSSDATEWWFQEAEATFRILERDHELRLVKRHRHQQGNFIVYEGRSVSVTIECAPDWNSLFGLIGIQQKGRQDEWRTVDIAEALASVAPEVDWRFNGDSGPIDREKVARTMLLWAHGLHQHLDDILAETGLP